MSEIIKEKKQGSLKKQLFIVTLIPLLIMTVAFVITAKISVDNVLVKNTNKELKETAHIALELYDQAYPGYFDIADMNTETGTFDVVKGGVSVLDTNDILDRLKKEKNVDISIFLSNTRVISTLMDINGRRYIASVIGKSANAPARVDAEVLKGGIARFYKDVQLGEDSCFVYYEPLLGENDVVIGMVGVAKKAKDVEAGAIAELWPIVAVAAVCALVFALIIITSVRKISDRLKGVETFVGKIAKGTFNNDIPKSVTVVNDEITSLADSGREMQEALRKLVECDTLTGLNNRRFSNNKLNAIHQSAERNGTTYCLGICDIDHFKSINDTYGHEAGDEVLKAVANLLKIGMGGNGYVARWGGEEFIVMFPNKDLTEAEAVLNNIRVSIQDSEIQYESRTIRVTLSSGVTESRPGESTDDALKRADANLYYAKEHGRNQVIAK